MFGEFLTRAITTAGAVISLVIGVATIVAAVATSFDEAVPVGLALAGFVYLLGGAAVLVRELVSSWGVRKWQAKIAFVLTAAFLVLVSVGFPLIGDFAVLQACGTVGLLFVPWFAVLWIRRQSEKHKASLRTCPDCAETIKARANVCRYCGYRIRGWRA